MMGGMPRQMPTGPFTLRVKVISGEKLSAMDANGKSDPYAILRFEGTPKPFGKSDKDFGKKSKTKGTKNKPKHLQTNVQKKTLNPNWNQTFDMVLPDLPQPTDILTVELYDYDVVGAHDYMGSAHVEMANLQAGVERVGTYKVFTKKGTVKIGLTALNFDVTPVLPGLEGNIQANKQTAAESAHKRAVYKKKKKAQDTRKDLGKGLKKGLKSLGKML